MITLITGGPGTGKTAWLLSQLIEFLKNEPDRLVYAHGIRSLKLPHLPIYCRSPLCDLCRSNAELTEFIKTGLQNEREEPYRFVENWPDWYTPGSLIIVDEVQRIWRPRSGSMSPPAAVSALETHRHYGLDFWLISQGPHLFDNFIRLLVGRHVHLVSRWSGRSQYEWPECKQDVTSRSDAVERPYRLPKHVYSLYHSAEVHTKQSKRAPMTLYVFLLLIPLFAFLFYRSYSTVNAKLNPLKAELNINEASGLAASPAMPPSQINNVTVAAFPDFTPIKPGVPESAPAYLPLIKVTSAPLLAGCVKSKDSCKCYTYQATPYPATNEYCLATVNGERFNPYFRSSSINQNQQISSNQQTDPVQKNIQ